MTGYHTHPEVFTHHKHQKIINFKLPGQIFGVSRKAETVALNIFFVDGSRNQHINQSFLQVIHCLFQCHQG